MRIKPFRFLIAFMLCAGYMVQAQQADFNAVYLSNYLIKSADSGQPVAEIITTASGKNVYTLAGPKAGLFVLKNDQLYLSKKGSTYFKKNKQAAVSIIATMATGTVIKKTFTLLKDEFLNNEVIAHRGAWKNTNAPQNSIASLNHAIRLGCAGTEFDIHLTADSIPVINHDADYQGINIAKTKYADLLAKKLKNGEPIPTLENYLKVGMQQQKTLLVAEIKPSSAGKQWSLLLAEKVVELVNRLQAQAWVVYISFDYDILKRVIELDKNAKTQYLNGNVSAAQLKADAITGADYHYSVLLKDENWIAKAHKEGIVVNAWTVNDTLVMDYFLLRQIDYLTTDEPEKLFNRLPNIKANKQWKLVWSDEFNYKGLPDSTKWNYDIGGSGWGNNEWQYYTNADTSNAKVDKGVLQVMALKKQQDDKQYTSARLVTKNKGDWKYGRVEVRAKLPRGRGLWPAIWMLPTDWKYGGWPASGEIDIMEHVGFNADSVFASVHTKDFNHMIGTQKTKGLTLHQPYDRFHIYAIEWNENKIDFYLNDQLYLSFDNSKKGSGEWPFDQRFHLLINIAVGGNWGGKEGVDETIFPAAMEVDYVRVFQ